MLSVEFSIGGSVIFSRGYVQVAERINKIGIFTLMAYSQSIGLSIKTTAKNSPLIQTIGSFGPMVYDNWLFLNFACL